MLKTNDFVYSDDDYRCSVTRPPLSHLVSEQSSSTSEYPIEEQGTISSTTEGRITRQSEER